MVHGRFPVVGGTAPVRGDISQSQPDQLGRRLVAREMATRLDDLTQSRIHARNRVGGVNHAPHFGWKGEEGNHVGLGPTPGRDKRGKTLSPRGYFESGKRFAIFPTGVVPTVARQMHDTGLQRNGGINHAERLARAFQSVGDRDQDVVAAARLQVYAFAAPRTHSR